MVNVQMIRTDFFFPFSTPVLISCQNTAGIIGPGRGDLNVEDGGCQRRCAPTGCQGADGEKRFVSSFRSRLCLCSQKLLFSTKLRDHRQSLRISMIEQIWFQTRIMFALHTSGQGGLNPGFRLQILSAAVFFFFKVIA